MQLLNVHFYSWCQIFHTWKITIDIKLLITIFTGKFQAQLKKVQTILLVSVQL